MSPRPRKATDDDIFAAAHRAMTRLGPGELTLAEIAAEAGVTAGLLVQRFGSKRALLLTLFARAAASTRGMMRALRASQPSALAALRAYAACMAEVAVSPAAFARNLAYLQIDIADPEFRVFLVRQARATRAVLQTWIAQAIDDGQLVGPRPVPLARTVEAVISGSLLTWAIYRQKPAAAWIRRDLDAVLAPYLVQLE